MVAGRLLVLIEFKGLLLYLVGARLVAGKEALRFGLGVIQFFSPLGGTRAPCGAKRVVPSYGSPQGVFSGRGVAGACKSNMRIYAAFDLICQG